ncbi:MAG TPA: hypothetical protein VJR89_25420 [Polyangiales bacterium]|nr:hypothetical protein [Polyangiales bacterium]
MRLARSTEFMFYALFALTVVCLLVLCAIPRALAPDQVPALVLDRARTAAVVRADAAARAPTTETARTLDARFLDFGSLENRTLEGPMSPDHLRRLLNGGYEQVVRESGEPAALALRSAAVERMESALALRLPDAETERVLGLFPEALARYGVTRNGFEIAPHFVLRTLYKARWNLAMGLDAAHKLEPIELEAYHGWLALHASNLSPEPRIVALRDYAAAGGHGIAEARGALAFMSHDYKQAVAALEAAYDQSPSLRIRNWLRGARAAAAAVAGEE